MTTQSPEESATPVPPDFVHVTVLKAEVVAAVVQACAAVTDAGLVPWVVDCTLGGGGHTEAILDAVPTVHVLGLDRDPAALAAASARLVRFGRRFTLVHTPFGGLAAAVHAHQLPALAAVVADLGVSSHQFDVAERGFSLRLDGPLDMRMDPTRGPTLAEKLATVTVEDLADVLYQYGDIRRSIGTARIVLQSVQEGADTTGKLAQKLAARLPKERNVHPATLVFQALRIWLNDELGELETLLRDAPGLLAPGGVLAVISFHSGEDRLVKQAMRTLAPKKFGPMRRGGKLAPGEAEVSANPRARSARLRTLWRATEAELAGRAGGSKWGTDEDGDDD